MRTIAILNFKGGVGKTVTTATLACLLAKRKKRVLAIDADSQGNLSQYFGVEPTEDDTCTTMELLTSGAGYYPDFVTPTCIDDVDVIPADIRLLAADVDATVRGETHRDAIEGLREALEEDAGDPDGYDYLLIDCPPALSTACAAALIAADEVIIPIRLDAFSTGGMSNLVFQITNMRRINPRLRVRGVLVTQYTRTEEERQALEVLRGSQLPVFETVIRFSKRVCAGTFAKMPLVEFSPWCAAAQDYRDLTEELLREDGDGHGKA